MTTYRYRSLPRGNEDQFPEIIACLKGRGVRLERSELGGGGVLFRWPAEDTSKMPRDDEDHYFGTDEQGFSIFAFGDEIAEEWRVDFHGSDWAPA